MIKLGVGITFGVVEDETLICNSKTNKMIKLDRQGTEIWKCIYKMEDINLVIDYFILKYKDTNDKIIIKDISSFYNSLIDNGVISNEMYKKI